MMKDKYFEDKWLNVKQSDLPDEINWPNLRFSKTTRICLKTIIWLIALVLVCLSMIGIVYMKKYSVELNKEYNTKNILCEIKPPTP